MIDLESQKLSSVEQYCDEIDEIAGRLHHALPPVSAVFRLLAQLKSFREAGSSKLDHAFSSLREFDDKAHLAYALNFVAQDALVQGQLGQALMAATEALAAARAMSRTTEIVVAGSVVACAEWADGDRSGAIARVRALASEFDYGTLSARARSNLKRAAHDVGFVLEHPLRPRKLVT